jgi:hypothetical protein
MCRQVGRFEYVDLDGRAVGIEDHCRETETCTPTGFYKPRLDIALEPAAFESTELMIV